MKKQKRDRKIQHLDQEQHYADLAENKPPASAVRAFNRKPYDVVRGESVAEYMAARKCDIKKGLR